MAVQEKKNRNSREKKMMNKNMLYRSIPKVDVLLENETIQDLIDHYSRDTVIDRKSVV